MKLNIVYLVTLFKTSAALLDCSAQISRSGLAGDRNAVCDHFAGTNPDAYFHWYDSSGIANKYPQFVYLPGADPSQPENGVAIHWDADKEFIYLAIAARAEGWLGFGIGEAGGMIGADMVLFKASQPDELIDAYTTDERSPKIDDCSSDWELVSAHVDEENGFIMFETKRKLDTGDTQDKVVVNDASTLIPPHRVIAAWGDTEDIGYHGLGSARGAIRFFGEADERGTFEKVMAKDSEGYFDVRSINHEITTNETEYFHTCVTREDLINQGVNDTQDMLNIIGFEPIISEGNEAYVHHFVVQGFPGTNCTGDGAVVYVWAPGEHPLTLPDFLGSPLFGENGEQAFEVQVHYNNPSFHQGVVDNSGVRLYWTSQPRDEQLGIMLVGDPNVNLYGQPVGSGPTLHQFECPGSCSSIVNRPVTVLREMLHMHETGARITNEQIRDGQVIRSGNIEFWEFEQNGAALAQQDPFEILPGDGFRTSCYFDGKDDRIFGLSSDEEMCMAFLMYYPRVSIKSTDLEAAMGIELPPFEMPWICGYDLGLAPCDTTYSTKALESVEEFDRAFGVKKEGCQANVYSDDDTSGGNSLGRVVAVLSGPAFVLIGFLL